MPTLFLLFNHALTPNQEADARVSLGVDRFVKPPPVVQGLWSRVPPELTELGPYLQPVLDWLEAEAVKGDYLLVQGDFGACYLVVGFAFENGLVPLYSTTVRDAEEEHQPDGSVRLVHTFLHQRFRFYGW